MGGIPNASINTIPQAQAQKTHDRSYLSIILSPVLFDITVHLFVTIATLLLRKPNPTQPKLILRRRRRLLQNAYLIIYDITHTHECIL